jgi:hypothetical protein
MKSKSGFFAYPGGPREIGDIIELSAQKSRGNTFTTWKALDIIGHFISEKVLSTIDEADFLIADITKLNFNVTYEIGYAIGKSKKIVLTKNKSINIDGVKIQDVGIFDTLGYFEYQNANELLKYIENLKSSSPIDISTPINSKAPVYILETLHKTDWASRIISRIKKAGYIFRTFDPNETPRLSAYDAISQVAQSYGIVVPLLSSSSVGYEIHNMRGAFIAGLAAGIGRPLCIIQNGDDPVPIDYRDFVNVTYHPRDVNEIIAEFASKVATEFQQSEPLKPNQKSSFLKRLNLGATSAENEMRDLGNYYLETDQYLKSLRGEAHIVVGRKGSGKSAIFLQIRDREREINRSKNIVLDLKPDGYKLIKFKEQILSFLEEGTYQHTITAFWEYLLLLEICYKILEKDKERHIRDHLLFDGYRELGALYKIDEYDPEGDFSERMSGLMEKVHSDFRAMYGERDNVRLSSAQVTQLLYKHDVRKLQEKLINYMEHKGSLWLLFDNIDKGWPTSGLKHEDLLIIRALIEATRKIERQFSRNELIVNTIVFLRNDVYELLVKETSDRGKEASVILDWTDPDLLRELIRLRIVSNGLDENTDFMTAWHKIFVSHYHGEETSQYLIDRSLMRPRFLLNLINQCKSFAINLNHDRVNEKDIEKGVIAYSTDLLRDIGYELVDVSGVPEDILYSFIGSNSELTETEAKMLMQEFGLDSKLLDKIFRLLLWYGFLGIRIGQDDTKYIYDYSYKMSLMEGIIKKNGDIVNFFINQAFWPSLMINEGL